MGKENVQLVSMSVKTLHQIVNEMLLICENNDLTYAETYSVICYIKQNLEQQTGMQMDGIEITNESKKH